LGGFEGTTREWWFTKAHGDRGFVPLGQTFRIRKKELHPHERAPQKLSYGIDVKRARKRARKVSPRKKKKTPRQSRGVDSVGLLKDLKGRKAEPISLTPWAGSERGKGKQSGKKKTDEGGLSDL